MLPNEAEVSAALGANSPAPALYHLPYCSEMKEMAKESMQKKFADEPVAMISIMPNGMPPMGKLLGLQILFFITSSTLIAYLTTLTIPAGSEYIAVFHFVFFASFWPMAGRRCLAASGSANRGQTACVTS